MPATIQSGISSCVSVEIDFELAGADGNRRDRFHFAGDAIGAFGRQGDLGLLAVGHVGPLAFVDVDVMYSGRGSTIVIRIEPARDVAFAACTC